MRPRDPSRLQSAPYDVLIVGGGIHGLACAYEAASRGLRTALVEKSDFGSAASFNHQKTAHGGLRSLQSASIRRARLAIRERRALARIAPWLLAPLPFIVGTYRSLTRNRIALGAAFALDRWLGRDRNDGIEPELHLPPARLLSRTATMKLFPGIRQEGLTGGAQWYDYQMVENDRLTFAFAAAADRAGADLAAYVDAREPLRAGGRIRGMHVRDVLSGADFTVEAGVVINAAGAGAGTIMAGLGSPRPFPLTAAMNLVTSKPAGDVALAAPDGQGRMLTLVPWRGRAIVGTGHGAGLAAPAGEPLRLEDVERFMGQANAAFPALRLLPGDITLVHHALVPAAARRDGAVDLLSESRVIDHGKDGAAGALTVVGAKYTSARALAQRAIELAGRKLKKPLTASRTASTTLPCAGIADHEALAIETARRLGLDVSPQLLRHLVGRYAEGAADIVTIMATRSDLAEPLAPGSPAVGAEIVHAIRREAAVKLSDVVLRRTTIGATGHPGAATLEACRRIAAAELGWNATQAAAEVDDVERRYQIGSS